MQARSQETDLGQLPEWNLTDLYPGPDSPALERDIEASARDADALEAAWKDKLDQADGDALAGAIAEYERLDERISRILSYGQLLYAGAVSDPAIARFHQTLSERMNAISVKTLFFTLEINRLDDAKLAEMLAATPALQRWEPWLRDTRAYRPHQLADDLEKLLYEKYVTGRAAWVRLFEETLANLRFQAGGTELTLTETLSRMSDREKSVRKEAAFALSEGLNSELRIFSLVTNTLAKDKEIEDRWRGFPRPVSSRNLANLVEDEVVDALAEAVQSSYADLSHRYYALKARWMGQDQLEFYDRLAPLPDEDDRRIPWQEAQETVLDAYGAFSPELAEVGSRFFKNSWIDAPPRPGKASGAFAHPVVPSAHPYLLLNYQGRPRDVMTLAHELGHGVHQILAGQTQGHFLANTPLTLAETASVFGEMLTFQSLLKRTTEPHKRRAMLAAKLEDMLNTVVRQISFYEFERRVHDARRKGELSAEDICEHWMAVSRESLGPAVKLDEPYKVYWAYIHHFIGSPFYVYAYAFGDCLVNSLYSLYEEAEDGFAQKYLDLLRAGGSLRHKELLAPFGLDASDPAFWQRGLGVLRRFLKELEDTF